MDRLNPLRNRASVTRPNKELLAAEEANLDEFCTARRTRSAPT